MSRISPFLWFDTQAYDAAQFYVSLFPNSKITGVTHYSAAGPREAGMVMTVQFVLDGQPVTALNGGPEFSFSEAISLVVDCADQAEVDHYWDALTADGGEPGPCGWLKDRFGLSWQIVPRQLLELLTDPDPARAQAANVAMLGMHKLDVAGLQAAADAAVPA